MPLSPGSRLGPYEIEAPIGAGGMGEVYRARDIRLNRTVALKVLPDALAADPELRERFHREARTISQLEHPHICTLHDLGEHEGRSYLVMQFLEGETLAAALSRGPLPLDRALAVATELADALAAAHRAGIVHRDLKPSNIMLTAGGARLLDFGLAKASAPLVAGAGASMLPTTPAGLTQEGAILGTLQYMSPEQLEGDDADARSDVFAFGAVLYEMITGARAFTGRSQASLVGAILKDSPRPLTALQPGLPAALDRLVMTCLAKRPDDRWQSMADLRRELRWAAESPSAPATAAPVPRGAWLPWTVAAVTLTALVALAGWFLTRPAPAAMPSTRLTADLPENAQYTGSPTPGRAVALSPDGRLLVYAVGGRGRQLHRRPLDRLAVEPIPGTEGAYQPFFSPDGRWIAFFTVTGELRKVPLEGGPAVTLVRGLLNGNWAFGAWHENTIVFSAFENLLRVSADGGTATAVTTLSEGADADLWHQFPAVVPSTGDIIFTAYDKEGRLHLDLLRRDTGVRSRLVADAAAAILLASGDLAFTKDGALLVARFDADARAVGPATPLSEPILRDRFGIVQGAVSPAGTLAYVAADPSAAVPVLGWMSRTGSFTEIGPLPAGVDSMALSPDGTQAVAGEFGTDRVFVIDLMRGVTSPLRVGRPVEEMTWHPDGRRITLGGAFLSLFDLDSGAATRLTPTGRPKRSPTWSRDARHLAYTGFEPDPDILRITLDESGAPTPPQPLISTDAPEGNPAISPDGQWFAYFAADLATGRTDVFVARYPSGTGRVQVTSSGGNSPVWNHNGRELFFRGPPGAMYAVPITLGERAQVGTPRMLFATAGLSSFSLSADASRFLVIRQPPVTPPGQFVIVQNWFEELRRLTAGR